MRESEVANIIIEWLKSDGWEIYKEVPFYGVRFDIVAVKHNIVWHIETKAHFNLKALEQASRYNVGHRRFVGFEKPKRYDWWIIKDVCMKYDTGIIAVNKERVVYFQKEKFFRKPLLLDRLTLIEEYKRDDIIAGSRNHYYSPYQETIKMVCEILSKGKKTIKEIMIELDGNHHYSSSTPERSLASAIINFERDIIDVEKVGNKYYYSLKNV